MSERTVFQSMSRRHVISLGPHATVHEAACVMTSANCGSVLAKALDPAKTLVSTVMTRHPRCVPPEMKVADAVVIMIERGFRHLPVVNEHDKKILGVFSVRDALPREIGLRSGAISSGSRSIPCGSCTGIAGIRRT